ncbi:MAG: tRNA guanosine(34) transglycosylase Tgt [Ruminococcaceae bacterium]|nr:tRNA guanosine(34) transglycosylase Tgt [Oscillospiraceae bacterium]
MFKLLTQENKARRGTFQTVHGEVQTPVFMNVATAAAIKGALSAEDLKTVGCQVALSNTYHLHLRPGDEIVRTMGGLHQFMNWDRPILTDSGGFQVFSLAAINQVKEEGVTFASHIDGRRIFMGPEESMQIQSNLGSTIAMAFDECINSRTGHKETEESAARTLRWLHRCKEAMERLNQGPDAVNPEQMLFGINQGGIHLDIRTEHMKQIAKLDLPGYAIGGLAVGETHEEMYQVLDAVLPHAPEDRPRYLMGVGTPANIIEAVARGVDFFDCVLPARNARHGHIFTKHGVMNIMNKKYETDPLPLDPDCQCPTCRHHSRAYLRHLMKAGEMLGMRLAVLHNLYFYNNLMAEIRQSIEENRFEEYRAEHVEKLATRI